ncbi:uroporphyrinogen decarboxylase [Moorella thermoacetica]|uniref:Uroporphyrinogen decarboxylase n=2 Tax=Neomoorella thermoacetica TaxID=1525 RepID=A0A1J5NDL1_NEOTH|nr:uroporphyrinogen decarboxylase family protein [Moorella thermoacetica]AKX95198.1 uroporphyrinogen decarboxylase [Moorella thermoacetica]AKX97823.1 uroporphyrinogen decarboxylase [Moorella thermoacetica]OIQ10001.1 uroporphyrinogen decarboxylase [Moorella thermoacetica]OIQ56654.1 uroporphyrinogen decarboxylase [Moorella thermoacetica]OIQ62539.1 uroporphyrinogen decarboxylase [Moorella thermoacetica]
MLNYHEILATAMFRPINPHVPVVLWAIGQTYAPFAKIPDNEYYADPAKMLEAQVKFYERFPDVLTIPGIWPDLGLMAELGALGAELEFPDDAPPQSRGGAFEDIREVENWEVPDPKKADYTSQTLDYLKYFCKHLPEEPRKKWGFLDGHIFCGGPGEISGLLLGYDKFSYAMYDYPQLVHILLRKVTDFIKSYIDAQIEIVGEPKRVIIWDHIPGMLSRELFDEFIHPYMKEVFTHVEKATLRIYHNENNYPHLLDLMRDIPANVCHIGPKHDLVESKRVLKKCVMGNVHPIQELLLGTNEEIEAKCKTIIETAGRGGGLWLSTGGGMAPETPVEKMQVLIDCTKKYLPPSL